MSAFEYYAKSASSAVNSKRKNKNKFNKNSVKKLRTGNEEDRPKKSTADVLNNIYNLNLKDSAKTGQKLLEWMIHPISVEKFMK